ncbi:MAG: lamin tail domain-containing protein [Anaplasmataceae bacterium]|nr:lamin tail domain-containing protein [Anaplasmataceae bacterium]
MQISEWVPNPVGKDSGNEWIEIHNDSSHSVNLAGWSVKNYKESAKVLPGVEISVGERVLFLASDLKLTLRNSDDYLVLINNEKEMDRIGFSGDAWEGYSYGRDASGSVSWLMPTPGDRNLESAMPMLADVGYIKNESGLSGFDFMILLLGSSILIVGYLLYTVRQDDYLAKLFLRGDE